MSNEIDARGSFQQAPHPGALDRPTPDSLIHIAVAQVLPDESGIHSGQSGLEKLERWAKKAAEEGADLLVFPEYFLSGATHELWQASREAQKRSLSQYSLDTDAQDQGEKHWLQFIIQVARSNDIDIVAGTVVELDSHIPHRGDEERQQSMFNTAYYVSRQGEVLHRYTKQNLWHPERQTLTDATSQTHPDQHQEATFTIETKRGLKLRAAMAICWDLAWYHRFAQMMRNTKTASDLDVEGQMTGPDLILAPTCWYASDGGWSGLRWNPNSEAQLLDTLCLSRSIETESIFVMCNVAGPSPPPSDSLRAQAERAQGDPPLIGLGRSSISAPFLGSIARLEDHHEHLLLQSVDTNVLKHSREMYRIRYDLSK